MRGTTGSMPIGYRWRSSKWFIIGTICIALFAGSSVVSVENKG